MYHTCLSMDKERLSPHSGSFHLRHPFGIGKQHWFFHQRRHLGGSKGVSNFRLSTKDFITEFIVRSCLNSHSHFTSTLYPSFLKHSILRIVPFAKVFHAGVVNRIQRFRHIALITSMPYAAHKFIIVTVQGKTYFNAYLLDG